MPDKDSAEESAVETDVVGNEAGDIESEEIEHWDFRSSENESDWQMMHTGMLDFERQFPGDPSVAPNLEGEAEWVLADQTFGIN